MGRGLVSPPQASPCPPPAANRVLVLASDGLWDAMDNEEATRLALKWRGAGAEYAARALCMEAYARGSQDNITAVVRRLVFWGAGCARGCCLEGWDGVQFLAGLCQPHSHSHSHPCRSYFFVPPPNNTGSVDTRLAAAAAAGRRWLASASAAALDGWRVAAVPTAVRRWGLVGLVAATAAAAGAHWRWPAALASP